MLRSFIKDLKGETAKVAAFLGKSMNEEELERLRNHLRFDNFAKNDAVNNEFGKELGIINPTGNFIRKGTLSLPLLPPLFPAITDSFINYHQGPDLYAFIGFIRPDDDDIN